MATPFLWNMTKIELLKLLSLGIYFQGTKDSHYTGGNIDVKGGRSCWPGIGCMLES